MPLKRSKEVAKGGLITVVEQQVTNVPLYEYLLVQEIVQVTIPVQNYYRGVLDHDDFIVKNPSNETIEIRPSEVALNELDANKRSLLDQPVYRVKVSDRAVFDLSHIELKSNKRSSKESQLILDIELPEAIQSGPQKILEADDSATDILSENSEINLNDIGSLLPDDLEIEFQTGDLTGGGFKSLSTSLEMTQFETEVIRAILFELVDEYASNQNYNFDTEMSIVVGNAIAKMISTEYDSIREVSND